MEKWIQGENNSKLIIPIAEFRFKPQLIDIEDQRVLTKLQNMRNPNRSYDENSRSSDHDRIWSQ